MYDELKSKNKSIAVVGLGYVGLPLLVALSKKFKVIGFDINEDKIIRLKKGMDENDEIGQEELLPLSEFLTSDPEILKKANFFIISVPTPIDNEKIPDLEILKSATGLVGKNMPADSIVVYESTVYPGVTEDICIPILENESGLVNLKDFFVGYSPERVNPGDKKHAIEGIVKVVSAQTEDSLEIIDGVYSSIIKAGTYRAKSIKVAEAAKVIENTQRDINVALINELAMIFAKLDIDTKDILAAAGTKWNFLDFVPGLVGGHCIGVDPYYLTFLSRKMGHNPEVINAGRKINDGMGIFIGEQIHEALSGSHENGKKKIAIFGITFKENVRDSRNSRVIDIYEYLVNNGYETLIYDPVVNKREVKENYGIALSDYEQLSGIDAAVFCVAHKSFKEIDLLTLKTKMVAEEPYIFDVKWLFEKEAVEKMGYKYWRL